MRSTGEVMGIADTFARAYEKALLAIGISLTDLRIAGAWGAARSSA